MKTNLGHVMPIALAVLAACSENKLEVGNGNDADVQCEYEGRMVGVDEIFPAKDNCNTCSCDPSSRQMTCTRNACNMDSGTIESSADGPIQCEYQGRMVGVDEIFPAKDNCNTCSCDPSSRQMICTRNACNMDGGGATATDTGSGGGNGGAGGSSGTGGSGGAGGDETACPFVASPKPIALQTVLGIGKSPSTGTIYVADHVDSLYRVFISDSSGTLVRQRVSGSGSSPDFMVFNTNGPDAIVTVQIDTPAGQPKRMGVVQGMPDGRKTIVIGQDGEELTMLAESAIANMPLRNLPGTVTTEYAASTEDGNFMLVTRPTDDVTYEDFRLFYGPLAAISERSVSSVMRAKDGGSTTIVFDLEGSTATARFNVVFADAGFAPGPATLTVGAQVSGLTRLGTPPADAKYVCKGAVSQCRWPAAVDAKDAGADNQCRAGRFLATCDLGNGTTSAGLRDDLGGCSNNCAENEYGVACGTIGPSSSPMPVPPTGCHTPSPTPAGIVYYCCPCL